MADDDMRDDTTNMDEEEIIRDRDMDTGRSEDLDMPESE